MFVPLALCLAFHFLLEVVLDDVHFALQHVHDVLSKSRTNLSEKHAFGEERQFGEGERSVLKQAEESLVFVCECGFG